MAKTDFMDLYEELNTLREAGMVDIDAWVEEQMEELFNSWIDLAGDDWDELEMYDLMPGDEKEYAEARMQEVADDQNTLEDVIEQMHEWEGYTPEFTDEALAIAIKDYLKKRGYLNESLKEGKNKKYIVRFDFSTFPDYGDGIYEETFDTKEAALKYIEDSYNNWYADNFDVSEEVIYPILCAAKEDEWEEDETGNYILESLKEAQKINSSIPTKLYIVSVKEEEDKFDHHEPKRHITNIKFYDPQRPTMMPMTALEFDYVRDIDSNDPEARKPVPNYGKWFEYNYNAYDYEGNLLIDINPNAVRTEKEKKILGNIKKDLVKRGLMDESFLDNLKKDTNTYTFDGEQYSAEDFYELIKDCIDSYRFDSGEDNIDISEQEAEEVAQDAFKELTNSNCKKPMYEVVSELLGL